MEGTVIKRGPGRPSNIERGNLPEQGDQFERLQVHRDRMCEAIDELLAQARKVLRTTEDNDERRYAQAAAGTAVHRVNIATTNILAILLGQYPNPRKLFSLDGLGSEG